MMGAFIGSSFYDRVMFLHDRFRRKKKLHKAFVEWDDEELDEMSGEMRNWIWNKQQARLRDERRLSHIRLTALRVARFSKPDAFDSDDEGEESS